MNIPFGTDGDVLSPEAHSQVSVLPPQGTRLPQRQPVPGSSQGILYSAAYLARESTCLAVSFVVGSNPELGYPEALR